MAQSPPHHARKSAAARRARLVAVWGLACPAAVWLAAFALCLLIQQTAASGVSPVVVASLVTASFLAHAALLLDEDHVAELLGPAR